LKNAARQLESGEGGAGASLRGGQQTNREERTKKLEAKTVLIVDPNPQSQESLKNLVEKLQFKTVCLNNPDDVQSVFRKDDLAAQCILFNGQTLGLRAVRGFNDFAQYRSLRDVGAILLVESGQLNWTDTIKQTSNRLIMTTPIEDEELRKVLSQMFEDWE
jgi:CheY-like chemotaxis protein